MHSVQSLKLDDNCMLLVTVYNGQSHFDQLSRLTHLRISLWNFYQCIDLLSQLGSQLHSLIRVARALPRLRTLEIINQLEEQEKMRMIKGNIDFSHLALLILYDIHMDYAQQFLCQIGLPSLIELGIN
ncbi:unnamed protein product, partial [Rotaria sordida]